MLLTEFCVHEQRRAHTIALICTKIKSLPQSTRAENLGYRTTDSARKVTGSLSYEITVQSKRGGENEPVWGKDSTTATRKLRRFLDCPAIVLSLASMLAVANTAISVWACTAWAHCSLCLEIIFPTSWTADLCTPFPQMNILHFKWGDHVGTACSGNAADATHYLKYPTNIAAFVIQASLYSILSLSFQSS